MVHIIYEVNMMNIYKRTKKYGTLSRAAIDEA